MKLQTNLYYELAFLWRTLSIIKSIDEDNASFIQFYAEVYQFLLSYPSLTLSSYWTQKKNEIAKVLGQIELDDFVGLGEGCSDPYSGTAKHIGPELDYLMNPEFEKSVNITHDPLGIISNLFHEATELYPTSTELQKSSILKSLLLLSMKSGRASLLLKLVSILISESQMNTTLLNCKPILADMRSFIQNKHEITEKDHISLRELWNNERMIESSTIKAINCRDGFLSSDAGILLSFGKADYGKLGHGDTQLHRLIPTIIEDLKSVAIVKAVSMSTYSIAIDKEGLVYVWGTGGSAGSTHIQKVDIRPQLLESLPSIAKVVDVSCGLAHALFLLDSNRVLAWGNGGNGRLGVGDNIDRTEATGIVSLYRHKIVSIQCGASHSLAMTDNGVVFSWGKNSQGQCGLGNNEDVLKPTQIKKFNGDIPAAQLSAGWEHTVILTSDGKLHSFGCGYKDSRRGVIPPVLGLGHNESRSLPETISSIENVTILRITCGWDHCLALDNKGRVLSWGSGQNGKLGHGSEENLAVPCYVPLLEKMEVIHISAGCEHSIAITKEGDTFSWGHGDGGRLGHGNNSQSFVPSKMLMLSRMHVRPVSVHCGDKFTLVVVRSTVSDNQPTADEHRASETGSDTFPITTFTREICSKEDELALKNLLKSYENCDDCVLSDQLLSLMAAAARLTSFENSLKGYKFYNFANSSISLIRSLPDKRVKEPLQPSTDEVINVTKKANHQDVVDQALYDWGLFPVDRLQTTSTDLLVLMEAVSVGAVRHLTCLIQAYQTSEAIKVDSIGLKYETKQPRSKLREEASSDLMQNIKCWLDWAAMDKEYAVESSEETLFELANILEIKEAFFCNSLQLILQKSKSVVRPLNHLQLIIEIPRSKQPIAELSGHASDQKPLKRSDSTQPRPVDSFDKSVVAQVIQLDDILEILGANIQAAVARRGLEKLQSLESYSNSHNKPNVGHLLSAKKSGSRLKLEMNESKLHTEYRLFASSTDSNDQTRLEQGDLNDQQSSIGDSQQSLTELDFDEEELDYEDNANTNLISLVKKDRLAVAPTGQSAMTRVSHRQTEDESVNGSQNSLEDFLAKDQSLPLRTEKYTPNFRSESKVLDSSNVNDGKEKQIEDAGFSVDNHVRYSFKSEGSASRRSGVDYDEYDDAKENSSRGSSRSFSLDGDSKSDENLSQSGALSQSEQSYGMRSSVKNRSYRKHSDGSKEVDDGSSMESEGELGSLTQPFSVSNRHDVNGIAYNSLEDQTENSHANSDAMIPNGLTNYRIDANSELLDSMNCFDESVNRMTGSESSAFYPSIEDEDIDENLEIQKAILSSMDSKTNLDVSESFEIQNQADDGFTRQRRHSESDRDDYHETVPDYEDSAEVERITFHRLLERVTAISSASFVAMEALAYRRSHSDYEEPLAQTNENCGLLPFESSENSMERPDLASKEPPMMIGVLRNKTFTSSSPSINSSFDRADRRNEGIEVESQSHNLDMNDMPSRREEVSREESSDSQLFMLWKSTQIVLARGFSLLYGPLEQLQTLLQLVRSPTSVLYLLPGFLTGALLPSTALLHALSYMSMQEDSFTKMHSPFQQSLIMSCLGLSLNEQLEFVEDPIENETALTSADIADFLRFIKNRIESTGFIQRGGRALSQELFWSQVNEIVDRACFYLFQQIFTVLLLNQFATAGLSKSFRMESIYALLVDCVETEVQSITDWFSDLQSRNCSKPTDEERSTTSRLSGSFSHCVLPLLFEYSMHFEQRIVATCQSLYPHSLKLLSIFTKAMASIDRKFQEGLTQDDGHDSFDKSLNSIRSVITLWLQSHSRRFTDFLALTIKVLISSSQTTTPWNEKTLNKFDAERFVNRNLCGVANTQGLLDPQLIRYTALFPIRIDYGALQTMAALDGHALSLKLQSENSSELELTHVPSYGSDGVSRTFVREYLSSYLWQSNRECVTFFNHLLSPDAARLLSEVTTTEELAFRRESLPPNEQKNSFEYIHPNALMLDNVLCDLFSNFNFLKQPTYWENILLNQGKNVSRSLASTSNTPWMHLNLILNDLVTPNEAGSDLTSQSIPMWSQYSATGRSMLRVVSKNSNQYQLEGGRTLKSKLRFTLFLFLMSRHEGLMEHVVTLFDALPSNDSSLDDPAMARLMHRHVKDSNQTKLSIIFDAWMDSLLASVCLIQFTTLTIQSKKSKTVSEFADRILDLVQSAKYFRRICEEDRTSLYPHSVLINSWSEMMRSGQQNVLKMNQSDEDLLPLKAAVDSRCKWLMDGLVRSTKSSICQPNYADKQSQLLRQGLTWVTNRQRVPLHLLELISAIQSIQANNCITGLLIIKDMMNSSAAISGSVVINTLAKCFQNDLTNFQMNQCIDSIRSATTTFQNNTVEESISTISARQTVGINTLQSIGRSVDCIDLNWTVPSHTHPSLLDLPICLGLIRLCGALINRSTVQSSPSPSLSNPEQHRTVLNVSISAFQSSFDKIKTAMESLISHCLSLKELGPPDLNPSSTNNLTTRLENMLEICHNCLLEYSQLLSENWSDKPFHPSYSQTRELLLGTASVLTSLASSLMRTNRWLATTIQKFMLFCETVGVQMVVSSVRELDATTPFVVPGIFTPNADYTVGFWIFVPDFLTHYQEFSSASSKESTQSIRIHVLSRMFEVGEANLIDLLSGDSIDEASPTCSLTVTLVLTNPSSAESKIEAFLEIAIHVLDIARSVATVGEMNSSAQLLSRKWHKINMRTDKLPQNQWHCCVIESVQFQSPKDSVNKNFKETTVAAVFVDGVHQQWAKAEGLVPSLHQHLVIGKIPRQLKDSGESSRIPNQKQEVPSILLADVFWIPSSIYLTTLDADTLRQSADQCSDPFHDGLNGFDTLSPMELVALSCAETSNDLKDKVAKTKAKLKDAILLGRLGPEVNQEPSSEAVRYSEYYLHFLPMDCPPSCFSDIMSESNSCSRSLLHLIQVLILPQRQSMSDGLISKAIRFAVDCIYVCDVSAQTAGFQFLLTILDDLHLQNQSKDQIWKAVAVMLHLFENLFSEFIESSSAEPRGVRSVVEVVNQLNGSYHSMESKEDNFLYEVDAFFFPSVIFEARLKFTRNQSRHLGGVEQSRASPTHYNQGNGGSGQHFSNIAGLLPYLQVDESSLLDGVSVLVSRAIANGFAEVASNSHDAGKSPFLELMLNKSVLMKGSTAERSVERASQQMSLLVLICGGGWMSYSTPLRTIRLSPRKLYFSGVGSSSTMTQRDEVLITGAGRLPSTHRSELFLSDEIGFNSRGVMKWRRRMGKVMKSVHPLRDLILQECAGVGKRSKLKRVGEQTDPFPSQPLFPLQPSFRRIFASRQSDILHPLTEIVHTEDPFPYLSLPMVIQWKETGLAGPRLFATLSASQLLSLLKSTMKGYLHEKRPVDGTQRLFMDGKMDSKNIARNKSMKGFNKASNQPMAKKNRLDPYQHETSKETTDSGSLRPDPDSTNNTQNATMRTEVATEDHFSNFLQLIKEMSLLRFFLVQISNMESMLLSSSNEEEEASANQDFDQLFETLGQELKNIVLIACMDPIHSITTAFRDPMYKAIELDVLKNLLKEGDPVFLEKIVLRLWKVFKQQKRSTRHQHSDPSDNASHPVPNGMALDSSGNITSTAKLIRLSALGGEISIQEIGKIRALSHFPSVRLLDISLERMSGRWFYECNLLSDGLMQIGWANSYFRCDPVCGQGVGDHMHSWAYDGLRTKKWNVSCESYGKRWKSGDVLGVLIDMDLMEMRFFLNGEDLGPAFSDFSGHELFPAFSLNVRQSIRLNFGQQKFLFPPDVLDGKAFQPVIKNAIHRMLSLQGKAVGSSATAKDKVMKLKKDEKMNGLKTFSGDMQASQPKESNERKSTDADGFKPIESKAVNQPSLPSIYNTSGYSSKGDGNDAEPPRSVLGNGLLSVGLIHGAVTTTRSSMIPNGDQAREEEGDEEGYGSADDEEDDEDYILMNRQLWQDQSDEALEFDAQGNDRQELVDHSGTNVDEAVQGDQGLNEYEEEEEDGDEDEDEDNEEDDRDEHMEQRTQLVELRRQTLVESLIGMGFPIDWALRAAEHCDISTSESAAISWIIERMELEQSKMDEAEGDSSRVMDGEDEEQEEEFYDAASEEEDAGLDYFIQRHAAAFSANVTQQMLPVSSNMAITTNASTSARLVGSAGRSRNPGHGVIPTTDIAGAETGSPSDRVREAVPSSYSGEIKSSSQMISADQMLLGLSAAANSTSLAAESKENTSAVDSRLRASALRSEEDIFAIRNGINADSNGKVGGPNSQNANKFDESANANTGGLGMIALLGGMSSKLRKGSFGNLQSNPNLQGNSIMGSLGKYISDVDEENDQDFLDASQFDQQGHYLAWNGRFQSGVNFVHPTPVLLGHYVMRNRHDLDKQEVLNQVSDLESTDLLPILMACELSLCIYYARAIVMRFGSISILKAMRRRAGQTSQSESCQTLIMDKSRPSYSSNPIQMNLSSEELPMVSLLFTEMPTALLRDLFKICFKQVVTSETQSDQIYPLLSQGNALGDIRDRVPPFAPFTSLSTDRMNLLISNFEKLKFRNLIGSRCMEESSSVQSLRTLTMIILIAVRHPQSVGHTAVASKRFVDEAFRNAFDVLEKAALITKESKSRPPQQFSAGHPNLEAIHSNHDWLSYGLFRDEMIQCESYHSVLSEVVIPSHSSDTQSDMMPSGSDETSDRITHTPFVLWAFWLLRLLLKSAGPFTSLTNTDLSSEDENKLATATSQLSSYWMSNHAMLWLHSEKFATIVQEGRFLSSNLHDTPHLLSLEVFQRLMSISHQVLNVSLRYTAYHLSAITLERLLQYLYQCHFSHDKPLSFAVQHLAAQYCIIMQQESTGLFRAFSNHLNIELVGMRNINERINNVRKPISSYTRSIAELLLIYYQLRRILTMDANFGLEPERLKRRALRSMISESTWSELILKHRTVCMLSDSVLPSSDRMADSEDAVSDDAFFVKLLDLTSHSVKLDWSLPPSLSAHDPDDGKVDEKAEKSEESDSSRQLMKIVIVSSIQFGVWCNEKSLSQLTMPGKLEDFPTYFGVKNISIDFVCKGSLFIDDFEPDTQYQVFVARSVHDIWSYIEANQTDQAGRAASNTTQLPEKCFSATFCTELQGSFRFDPADMSPNIIITKQNPLTIRNITNKKWSSVRGTHRMVSGQHRWDVHIDRCVSKNVFLGVATKEARLDNYIGCDKFGWAFLANKAVWHGKSKVKSYGELFRTGDTITIFLNFDDGTLSFYLNEKPLGVAIEGLTGPLYPAFSLYNEEDQLTILQMQTKRSKRTVSERKDEKPDFMGHSGLHIQTSVSILNRLDVLNQLLNCIHWGHKMSRLADSLDGQVAAERDAILGKASRISKLFVHDELSFELQLRWNKWSQNVGIRTILSTPSRDNALYHHSLSKANGGGLAAIQVSSTECLSFSSNEFKIDSIVRVGPNTSARVVGTARHKLWLQVLGNATNDLIGITSEKFHELKSSQPFNVSNTTYEPPSPTANIVQSIGDGNHPIFFDRSPTEAKMKALLNEAMGSLPPLRPRLESSLIIQSLVGETFWSVADDEALVQFLMVCSRKSDCEPFNLNLNFLHRCAAMYYRISRETADLSTHLSAVLLVFRRHSIDQILIRCLVLIHFNDMLLPLLPFLFSPSAQIESSILPNTTLLSSTESTDLLNVQETLNKYPVASSEAKLKSIQSIIFPTVKAAYSLQLGGLPHQISSYFIDVRGHNQTTVTMLIRNSAEVDPSLLSPMAPKSLISSTTSSFKKGSSSNLITSLFESSGSSPFPNTPTVPTSGSTPLQPTEVTVPSDQDRVQTFGTLARLTRLFVKEGSSFDVSETSTVCQDLLDYLSSITGSLVMLGDPLSTAIQTKTTDSPATNGYSLLLSDSTRSQLMLEVTSFESSTTAYFRQLHGQWSEQTDPMSPIVSEVRLDVRWSVAVYMQCCFLGQLVSYLETLASLNSCNPLLSTDATNQSNNKGSSWECMLRRKMMSPIGLWADEVSSAKQRTVPFVIRHHAAASSTPPPSSHPPPELVADHIKSIGSISSFALTIEEADLSNSPRIELASLFNFQGISRLMFALNLRIQPSQNISEWTLFALFIEESIEQVQRFIDCLFESDEAGVGRIPRTQGPLGFIFEDGKQNRVKPALVANWRTDPTEVRNEATIGVVNLLLQYFHFIGVILALGLRHAVSVHLELPDIFLHVLSSNLPIDGCTNQTADTVEMMAIALRNGMISMYPEPAWNLFTRQDVANLIRAEGMAAYSGCSPAWLYRYARYDDEVSVEDNHIQYFWLCLYELSQKQVRKLVRGVHALASSATGLDKQQLNSALVDMDLFYYSFPSSNASESFRLHIMKPSAVALMEPDASQITIFPQHGGISLPRCSSLSIMASKLEALLSTL